jgi:RecB family exonuclease
MDRKTEDQIWRVSASQIKTWKDCPRKWGFKYIDGLEDPPGKAAELGSAVHRDLEWYLQAGSIDSRTESGRIAVAAKEILPGPSYRLQVEREIVFELDGITYRGFIDLIDPDGEEGPTIYDHKTSSDPRRWGLTEETLPEDVQALIYATWGILHWDLDSVALQWSYLKTRGQAEATAVRAKISKDDALQKIREKIRPAALAIVEASSCAESATELDPNPAACSKFGGCPFSDVCERSEDQLLESTLGKKTEKEKGKEMTLKELLRSKNAKKAPPRANEFAAILPPEADTKKEEIREEEVALKGQQAILDFISDVGGTAEFSKSRSAATTQVPFAHGGSLFALGKAGKITISDKKTTRECSLLVEESHAEPEPVVEETPVEETPVEETPVEEAPTRSILQEARISNNPEYADDRRELFMAMAKAGYTPEYLEQILDLFDAKIVSWSRG